MGFDVTTISLRSEAFARGARMLRTALGPAIAGFLEDASIVEVMLNPDGRLWIDRLSEGLSDTGERLTAADGERIVRLVAHHVGAEVHAGSPRVSAELPETRRAVRGSASTRRHGARLCDSPSRQSRCSPSATTWPPVSWPVDQAEALRMAVAAREEHSCRWRHVDRQDHAHQCAARRGRQDRRPRGADRRHPRTSVPGAQPGCAQDQGRRRIALRSRTLLTCACGPIAFRSARCRGAEALDLLEAQGTGHPGGIGTIHAGSALGALHRLEQLIQEAVATVPRALIAETIDLVAVLVRPRFAAAASPSLMRVTGLGPDRRLRPLTQQEASRDANACADYAVPSPRRTSALVTLAHVPARLGGRLEHARRSSRSPRSSESVQGPVAKVMSVIIIAMTGLTLAVGETSAVASAD